MINLKQLAKHLNLSQATVSRALNNYSTVNSATKARVIEAANALGYRANTSARQLATGKTGAFGIVLPAADNLLMDPHFVDFLAGLTSALAVNDLDLVLSASDGIATYRRLATTRKVDALVLSAPKLDDPRIRELLAMNFPFIVHGRTDRKPDYAYFDIDNYKAFKDATRLLMDLGHQEIALLNGTQDSVFAIDRYRGYCDVFGQRGLVVNPELVFADAMTEENGYRIISQLIDANKLPTAILCSSALLTLGANRRFRDAGIVVGRDVSIVSHDDGLSSLKTENFSVPLTVTRSPIRIAGQEIGKMLIEQSLGASISALQKVVQAELVVRASTCAAPNRK